MKIGNIEFKRRYMLVQILVDAFSVLALLYIGFIIYVCAQDIEQIQLLNKTDADLSFMDWRPLIVWAVLGVIVSVVSVVLLLIPRKTPKRYTVNVKNAVKFCNAVDVCISCVRLMVLLALSEFCYIHMKLILTRTMEFSFPLIIQLAIIAALIWFTVIRLRAISNSAIEEDKKEKNIIQD